MKPLTLTILLLVPVVSLGSDLTEAAQKADEYWRERYTPCVHPKLGEVWYGLPDGPTTILTVLGAKAHFRTEDLSEVETLNGVQYKATISLHSKAFRLWKPADGWLDWNGSIDDMRGILLIKRNGTWSTVGGPKEKPDRKLQCSQVPQ